MDCTEYVCGGRKVWRWGRRHRVCESTLLNGHKGMCDSVGDPGGLCGKNEWGLLCYLAWQGKLGIISRGIIVWEGNTAILQLRKGERILRIREGEVILLTCNRQGNYCRTGNTTILLLVIWKGELLYLDLVTQSEKVNYYVLNLVLLLCYLVVMAWILKWTTTVRTSDHLPLF